MNQLEERILRLLIEKDNPYQAVPITFSDVELPYIIEAIKHLDNMGYVKQACTLCSASAILTSCFSALTCSISTHTFAD